MALIGISIFVLSVSFLCYRHPPFSWARSLFALLPLESKSLKEISDPAHQSDVTISISGSPAEPSPPDDNPSTSQIELQEQEVKAELDRNAMPPPPPPLLRMRPSAPPTPTLITANSSPTSQASVLSSTPQVVEQTETKQAPSFPARNSIQRASGGRAPTPSMLAPQRQPPLRSHLSPLPMRSPNSGRLPNRTPNSSLSPPPTQTGIPAKPSRKVLLTPGHSPLDWAQLTSRPDVNLRGLPPLTPYLRVPPSLLKQYNGRPEKDADGKRRYDANGQPVLKDAWTVLSGKVYNISPYLPYHPGGEPELLRCAGKDGTKLFGEIHPWVNWEGMLESCLVGIAVAEMELKPGNSLEDMD